MVSARGSHVRAAQRRARREAQGGVATQPAGELLGERSRGRGLPRREQRLDPHGRDVGRPQPDPLRPDGAKRRVRDLQRPRGVAVRPPQSGQLSGGLHRVVGGAEPRRLIEDEPELLLRLPAASGRGGQPGDQPDAGQVDRRPVRVGLGERGAAVRQTLPPSAEPVQVGEFELDVEAQPRRFLGVGQPQGDGEVPLRVGVPAPHHRARADVRVDAGDVEPLRRGRAVERQSATTSQASSSPSMRNAAARLPVRLRRTAGDSISAARSAARRSQRRWVEAGHGDP